MNHISLETAKKLHELGFTKETYFYWVERDSGDPLICPLNVDQFLYTPIEGYPAGMISTTGCDCCATQEYGMKTAYRAPLAEELLEVLPRRTSITHLEGGNAEWMVRVPISPKGTNTLTLCHKSLSEALALLLIELVEQGVVSKEQLQ